MSQTVLQPPSALNAKAIRVTTVTAAEVPTVRLLTPAGNWHLTPENVGEVYQPGLRYAAAQISTRKGLLRDLPFRDN
jgi:hypothetical protein